jgi:tetratricopeptide (TPR) repeat protein
MVSFAGAFALAEGELQVAAPANSVVNPFSAKRQAPAAAEVVAPPAAAPTSVPQAEQGVPKAYQNPFAQNPFSKRPAAPRFVTPQLHPGPLSRWNQAPVSQPHHATLPDADRRINFRSGGGEVADEGHDLMGPLSIEQDKATLFALPGGEPPGSARPVVPPDPSYFGTENIVQPNWLPPDESQEAASVIDPAELAESTRSVAQPQTDPFENDAEIAALPAADSEVIISDDEPSLTSCATANEPGGRAVPQVVRPLPPTTSKGAEEWYADAEQAAAEATTPDQLAAVVHLCRRGLECRPPQDQATALRSLAAWSCNRCGELESEQRREDEALKAFELAIQWDPSCWLALHNRAVSRAQQGNLEGALADFNRALELNPGLAVAYRNRGELLAATGRTEEAVADYSNALTQLPNDAELHAMRGHALHRLGRYEQATKDLGQSIEIAPHQADVFAHRGNVYAELGEYGRAIDDFRQALALDAQSADAHRSLAWLLATCPDAQYRNPHEAVAAAQAAMKIAAAGDPFMLDTLAAAYASAGQFDQAVRFQEEAIANVPANFAEPFNERLALYRAQQPFRNGATVDNDVRAASLEADSRASR